MDPAADQLEKARNAILACAYEEAIAACREAIAQCPKHIEAACLLAEAYREQGKHRPAEDLLRRVLSADPENILALWALGLLLRDQGRDQEAMAILLCARELAPGNQELLSDLLSLTSDMRGILRPTRALLARYYATAGLYGRAVEEFKAALQTLPQRLDLWVALAEALWRAGELIEAEAVCEAIIEESPDCLKALLVLARVRAEVGDPSAAADLLAHANQLDPAGVMLARLS